MSEETSKKLPLAQSETPVEAPAGVPTAPTEIRENMVATAIKFLQNPKVRESEFSQRRAFLEKKGLTTEEIDVAIERSGTKGDQYAVQSATPQAPPSRPPMYPQQQMQPYHGPPPESIWHRTREFISTAIVVGGISYAVYKLFKVYVAPHWFRPSKEEEQLVALQKSIAQLNKNMEELLKTMQETQVSLADMARSAAASKGANEVSKMHGDERLNDIKEEIRSLKGLMLSHKQFPSVPSTKPLLPAWQLSSVTPASVSSPGASKPQIKHPPDTSKADIKDSPETSKAEIKDSPETSKAGSETSKAEIKDSPETSKAEIKDSPETSKADIKDSPDTSKEDIKEAKGDSADDLKTVGQDSSKQQEEDLVNGNVGKESINGKNSPENGQENGQENGPENGPESGMNGLQNGDPRMLKEVVQDIMGKKDGEKEEGSERGSPKKVMFCEGSPTIEGGGEGLAEVDA